MKPLNLTNAVEGTEYIIKKIEIDNEKLDSFFFSLGCYAGEPITVISNLEGGCVISIKAGRYNIDTQLASAILILNVAEIMLNFFDKRLAVTNINFLASS